jgi:catechol 2,3-dioxygenase-like lactoylglutathione lyase family enzyme
MASKGGETVRLIKAVTVLIALFSANIVSAQLTAASKGPIVYGHHHLNVTNVDEHKRFWVDTLGGTAVPWGDAEIVKFSNVLVFMREQAPSGGTKGTTVNHIGFSVPSIPAVLEKVRAAGYPIVSREEFPSTLEVTDGIAYSAEQDTYLAFLMAPDDVKVELVERRTQTTPITLHHIHFATQHVDDMKAWYVKTLNAAPGMRGAFQAADLPGVNLTFSASQEALAGTQGRSLDHIGFEVDGLEAFCKNLEAQGITFDRPYREIEARGIAIAYFTDPFGTYIELTEGLDNL